MLDSQTPQTQGTNSHACNTDQSESISVQRKTKAHFPGRLLLLGAGAMGEAILSGIVASKTLSNEQILVVEPCATRRDYLRKQYQCQFISALSDEAFGPQDVCLMAVKPQIARSVLKDLNPRLDRSLFISIAVSITIADYYKVLDSSVPVVRVMPNLPMSIGQGVSLVSSSDTVSDQQKAVVDSLFESAGSVEHIPEAWQTAGATISGSGPAYFSYMMDAMIAAGSRAGMPKDLSLRLAAHTAVGVSNMLLAKGMSPQEMMDATSSPGGTTEVAIKQMNESGVHDAIVSAFFSAESRARELESGFGD